jgi:hypothetical protein
VGGGEEFRKCYTALLGPPQFKTFRCAHTLVVVGNFLAVANPVGFATCVVPPDLVTVRSTGFPKGGFIVRPELSQQNSNEMVLDASTHRTWECSIRL